MSVRDRPASLDSADTALLPRLLAGAGRDDLPIVDAMQLHDLASEFSPRQRAAIAAALSTPDICLIQNESTAERSELASAIIARAAGSGLRVRALSGDGTPLPILCPRGAGCPECSGARTIRSRWSVWNWLDRLLRSRRSTPCGHLAAATKAALTSRGKFDCLIVTDAQMLSEEALLAAAESAHRWILLGSADPSPETAQPCPFRKLWQYLCFEPWGYEGQRIVCRLRPVPGHRRKNLEIEAVADRPDIELRILAEPNGMPQLAEIAFPDGVGITEAKNYVFEQLGEAPLCAMPAGGCWSESADAIVLTFDERFNPNATTVPLADGVCELITAIERGWATNSLRFAHAAGWDATTAAKWIQQRSERHLQSRTIRLAAPCSAAGETVVAGRSLETMT